MVELWVKLITNRRKTFSQVPEEFKADVKKLLACLGLDENGNPTM